MTRARPTLRRLALLQLLCAGAALQAAPAAAQVVPAEPFGGRPFGSSAVQAPQPVPQPQAVPLGPGGIMVQPGSVLVQPVPVPAPPQVQPQFQPMAQPQAMQAPAPAMQAPVPAPAPAMQAPPPPAQAPAMTAPPPGARNPMTPPFQGTPGAQRGPVPPPAAAAAAPPPVKGLPPDAPPLVVAGAVWSADARQRRLLVNGVPLAEGADAGGGVVVREIGRERAVLEFRGQGYAVAY